MKLFGLTGGIGMGKSTSARFLAGLGLPVADTDAIAREIVQPGQEALEEVKRRFGDGIVGSGGELKRDELARRVFADAKARRDLERILHPRIRRIWLSQVEQWREEGKLMGAVIIPLLFETGAEKHFDATICVTCGEATQRARLLERGWTIEQIRQRIDAQWPIEKKLLLSNYVIWTEGDLDVHREQLERVLTTA